MTRDQAVAYIQQGLAFRSDLSTEILAMLDLLQYDELEKGTTLPYFLLLEDQTLAGTANIAFVTLPAAFIRHWDLNSVRSTDDDDNVTFLRKMEYGQLIAYYREDDTGLIATGVPAAYALRNTTLTIAPVPDVAFTITHDYFAHDSLPSSLAAAATNIWLTSAPGILLNLAGARMAQDLEHVDAETKFMKRYSAANARQVADIALREDADREWVMGQNA